jgi:uncharacterized glyoxalase superfamily protein PhnB
MVNRSVPTNTVLPHVMYRNVADAIAWLTRTFGFTEHYRYGDPGEISGAQMYLGNACLMLKRAGPGSASPAQLGYGTQSLTVFVDDVDAHFQRTKSAGAKILEELHETVYGERQYGVEDLDGHHWLFSQHARDLSPDEWGATISSAIPSPLALLPRPRLCYLHIPAVDVRQSVSFYEKVFSWNIRRRDSAHPSFDDATGYVSGAWFTGGAISREPGLHPFIWVDDIDATLARVSDNGGEVVEASHHDSPGSTSWIATFRDPAGNAIGLYQESPR